MKNNEDHDEEIARPKTPNKEDTRPHLAASGLFCHMMRNWFHIAQTRLWLAIWLVILMTAVVFVPIAFLFEDLWLGLAALIAGAGICAVNLPLYCRARGFDKSMSAGHLPFLIPLLIYWTIRLLDGLDLSSTVWVVLFYFMFVALWICLLFDIYDAYQWFWKRNRDVITIEEVPTET